MCVCVRERGRIFLINNPLKTFYLRLYGIGHTVKDVQIERKPAAATTWATHFDYQQGFFYMHHPTEMIAHTTAFDTPGWNEK